MKVLPGGAVALIIAVLGVIGWRGKFLRLLKGCIPLIIVLGGALAIYLGIEDIKTTSTTPVPEAKK